MTIADLEPPHSRLVARPVRGRGSGLCESSVEFEVPFHDVDALQVVWFGNYYKYLDVARTELFRNVKLDSGDFAALGCGLFVIESACRYVSPLRYGDRVRVTAWLTDVRYRLAVSYEIENLSAGRRAARGQTVLVTTTLAGEMNLRTPRAVLERLGATDDGDTEGGAR